MAKSKPTTAQLLQHVIDLLHLNLRLQGVSREQMENLLAARSDPEMFDKLLSEWHQSPSVPERNSIMSGTFVSVSGNTVTLSHDGAPKQDTTHEVSPSASVTINGNKSSLDQLKAGDSVTLSGNPATLVKATR